MNRGADGRLIVTLPAEQLWIGTPSWARNEHRGQSCVWALGLACLFALMMALPAMAADAPKVERTNGKITKISADSITVQPRTGDAKTFTINAATQVRIDGKPAAATDLKVDQRVRVNSSDGKTALEIINRVRAPKAGTPAAPAAPATPAAP